MPRCVYECEMRRKVPTGYLKYRYIIFNGMWCAVCIELCAKYWAWTVVYCGVCAIMLIRFICYAEVRSEVDKSKP